MATVIPRIGQRSILNSSLAGSLKAKSLTTVTVNSPEYFSTAGSDIVFNTVNFDPTSNNPKGVLEQVRIDNSGNIAYFGSAIPSLRRSITDVSLNLDCCNRITDIYVTSRGTDTPFSTGIRVIVKYKNWGSEYVSVVVNVLCTIKNDSSAAYTCIGEIVKLNQASPNEEYFDTSTTGLTATNGSVSVDSQYTAFSKLPYGLIFSFEPSTTPISLTTIHIKLVSSTTAAQIDYVEVDAPPP